MDDKFLTIILAAGEGKRMASALPKVLHPVAGLPMVLHVAQTAIASGSGALAVVVGNQAEQVRGAVANHSLKASFHEQTERRGTGHAVLAAREALREGIEEVIILYGDVPLVRPETVLSAREAIAKGADIVVLGFETAMPTGYGRLIVHDGELQAIREEKDATPEEKSITFCNSGIMAFRSRCILDVLEAITDDNAQNEYYLTDAAEIGRAQGLSVKAIAVAQEETIGVNDRVQLSAVEHIWQERKRRELLLAGVAMAAPATVHFSHDTMVERNATIEPNVVFGPGVEVATGAMIRAFSHLEGAKVGEGAIVGPYGRLRPGTELARGAKVGNFVEVKAANIGEGAKINHLSYVGDASVGAGANIGAGSVTCNYDGFNKHHTAIGEGAFIGTNTSLVAPLSIGNNANTAAGSVVTDDVPEDAMAFGRARQVNVPEKARTMREQLLAIKRSKKD